jgi:hypothetical protein
MSWDIPGENLALAMIGFLLESKTGISFAKILCKINPNDHISIFYRSSLDKFSGKIIFYLSYGAK